MKTLYNKEKFEKRFINLCPCVNLDIDLKTIFARYIRAFGEFRSNNFETDELTWNLLQGTVVHFSKENKSEIIKILKKIRNYNAHFFYDENVFNADDNIIQFLDSNYKSKDKFHRLNLFFENFIKQVGTQDRSKCLEKKCFVNSEVFFAKWSFFFFSVSIILYKSEYQQLKEQIIKFLRKKIKKDENSLYFSECLEIFNKHLNFFEKEIGVQILNQPSILNSKDVVILDEMQDLIKNTQTVFKNFIQNYSKTIDFEFKTELSLLKMVKILDSILDFDEKLWQNSDYEVQFKIKRELYCDRCQEENEKKLYKLNEKEKDVKNFSQKNCFSCKRYFNNQSKNNSWYLTPPTYFIFKNLWRFHILPKKNQTHLKKIITISKLNLQKFFLSTFHNALKKEKIKNRELVTFFREKWNDFFKKLFFQNDDFQTEQLFINKILNLNSSSSKSWIDIQNQAKNNFLNKDYLKKYKYLENQNRFTSFDWKNNYKISSFFRDRKQKKIIKLQKLLEQLKIQKKSFDFLFLSFKELFEKFKLHSSVVSKVLRIRLKFILKFLNGNFFEKKLTTQHFNNVFFHFFSKLTSQENKISLWKILNNLKWKSNEIKKDFLHKLEKIKKQTYNAFPIESWDQIYFWTIKQKIELLKKEIDSKSLNIQQKDMKNFYFSILKLNNQKQKDKVNIKVNNYWFQTHYPEQISLNTILNDEQINNFFQQHLENFLQALNYSENEKDLISKNFFQQISSEKKYFNNKCEILLRSFLHKIFQKYLLFFKKDEGLRVYKKNPLNFINSSIAFRIEDNQKQYFDIVFENIQKVKINYLQIYNLNEVWWLKKFISNNNELKKKVKNNVIYFADLSSYVDKVHFVFENKKLTFGAWRIIRAIFMKERKKYQNSNDLNKEKIIERFNLKTYVKFDFLFNKNEKLIKLRNASLHLNPLTSSDAETFKEEFPIKFNKIFNKYAKEIRSKY